MFTPKPVLTGMTWLVLITAVILMTEPTDAAVVSDSNIILANGGAFGADYLLDVFQDPGATDITGMLFNLSGQTLSYANETADEGSDWYLTVYGDEFTTANISAAAFPLFVRVTSTGWESHDLNFPSADFYLGVNTGRLFSGGVPGRNIYGWVHLQNNAGTLTMLGNAMAYDEGGIVIGTTQAIPEPAASVLVALLACPAIPLRRPSPRRHRASNANG